MTDRYDAAELIRFGKNLFAKAGMPEDRAQVVSELLVEADLIGQTTHGLAQSPGYLKQLIDGQMPKDGMPDIIADRGAVATWDGKYMSGVWLVWHAVQVASERARTYGTATINIRKSHHIACLAAFLPLATEQGLMMILACSDPANQAVAPFGAYEPIYTPDPIAIGYPTEGDPILIDISASGTTMGMAQRLQASGEVFPGDWLVDNQGNPSRDPAVLQETPPGGLMPLGGFDRGHKGFGLGLFVEALTSGLGGYGRADSPTQWGASVFVQLIDPDAFGGVSAFRRETSWLAEASRNASVAPGNPPVRMPGDGANGRKRAALENGVELHPTILPSLKDVARELGVDLPTAKS